METILSTCDVPTIKRKTRVLGKKCPFSNKLENLGAALPRHLDHLCYFIAL